jgi:hypothetical protein
VVRWTSRRVHGSVIFVGIESLLRSWWCKQKMGMLKGTLSSYACKSSLS